MEGGRACLKPGESQPLEELKIANISWVTAVKSAINQVCWSIIVKALASRGPEPKRTNETG